MAKLLMDLEDFKKKYQKIPVEHFPHDVPGNPFVSVCIQTYQHAPYIKKCLDGVLMQETDFPFEILLGEDASTDGTREICIEYAKRYPDRIKLFLHHRENNIKVFGRQTDLFNFYYNLFSSKSKYIALCEGDDYWIDPLKIQKQVDFLEKMHSVIMCYTNAEFKDERDKIKKATNTDYVKFKKSRYLKASEVVNSAIPLMTRVFRNKKIDYFIGAISGDYVHQLELSKYGQIYFINEKTAVYRKNDSSISQNTNFLKWNLNTIYFLNDFKNRCLRSQLSNIYMKITELKIHALFCAYTEKKYLTSIILFMQVIFSKKFYKRKGLGVFKMLFIEVVVNGNNEALNRF